LLQRLRLALLCVVDVRAVLGMANVGNALA
jgi:hypothetical protein